MYASSLYVQIDYLRKRSKQDSMSGSHNVTYTVASKSWNLILQLNAYLLYSFTSKKT